MYRAFYSALRLQQIRYEELLREAERERELQALRGRGSDRPKERRKPSLFRRLFGLQARRRPVL